MTTRFRPSSRKATDCGTGIPAIPEAGGGGSLTRTPLDGSNRGWITTDDGFLLSEDNGQTWKLQRGDNQMFLNKILRATGTTWALGPFGMLKQTGAGMEWKKIVNPLSSNAVAEDVR